jgi:hypothetical protein
VTATRIWIFRKVAGKCVSGVEARPGDSLTAGFCQLSGGLDGISAGSN